VKAATPAILDRLEQYTGIPYPWDKLDHVAVLDMPYSAVENPGLITYREGGLLAAPEHDTLEHQRDMRGTMAHELSHQWFGNLVTQAWWDDVWLSEGFATWLGRKISSQELPPFQRPLGAAIARERIMHEDASTATRPVRLAMDSRQDMARVYGQIVYQKGAAILEMVEQWIGPDPFQRGLRSYLTAHAFRTATTADLAAALTRESGVDTGPVLSSFLDQPGFPTLTATVQCSAPGPRVTLSPDRPGEWVVPLCVHSGSGSRSCAVISQPRQDLRLEGSCPAWVWPNQGATGYFRVRLSAAELDAIVRKGWADLSSAERLSVVEDAAALASAHELDADAALRLLPVITRDLEPAIANAGYRMLLSMMATAEPADRAKYDEAAKRLLRGGRAR
jgi:alanyl aminopeptidase